MPHAGRTNMCLANGTALEAARAAKTASYILATLPTWARNDALTAIHAALASARDDILAANATDLEAARRAASAGELLASLVARLNLDKGKFESMLQGVLDVRGLPDPVGEVRLRTRLDEGLELERVACPIGVLLVIFEARPEVVANIAALAVKSGNAAILKGGKESTATFSAIARAISMGLEDSMVPSGAVQLVTTRDVIPKLLALDRYVDLVVPRGSNSLVRYIKENTRIPVLGHADGLCSIFLEGSADVKMAAEVVVDAKTSYPAACNSLETLLVQESALDTALPDVASALLAKGVELRCDAASKAALQRSGNGDNRIVDAADGDFDTEFLSLTLAVRTVASLEEAVAHINSHGSHHTDAIVTASAALAERFMAAVDSAGVYWNASTRFADGMRYGFGTEVGISTSKIHSRGPVGLDGLMIYKYKIRGQGHVAAVYGKGEGMRRFKHERLPL